MAAAAMQRDLPHCDSRRALGVGAPTGESPRIRRRFCCCLRASPVRALAGRIRGAGPGAVVFGVRARDAAAPERPGGRTIDHCNTTRATRRLRRGLRKVEASRPGCPLNQQGVKFGFVELIPYLERRRIDAVLAQNCARIARKAHAQCRILPKPRNEGWHPERLAVRHDLGLNVRPRRFRCGARGPALQRREKPDDQLKQSMGRHCHWRCPAKSCMYA
jgi:hypothetical protein